MLLTPLQASRLSLPQARVRVKWSNPLTRGLIFALVPGVGLVNLVTGEVATYSAGVSVTPSPGGKAARFTGDTAVRLEFPLSVGSGSFSLFTKVKLNNNASALPLGLFRVGGSPLATGNYIGVEASTQIVATSTELDNWNSAGGPNAVTGATYSLGASFTSGGGRVLYIGGNAAASSGTARAVTGLNRILVGVYQGGNGALYSPLNGDSDISLVWNRVLSAEEHAAVCANPSALLEADDLDLEPYYVAGGGADTSLRASATASGTATARLTTQITLKASAQASGTASARLSTQIRLQASAAASGQASARLTTAISLKASATASGTASARLTAGSSTLRASATASGTASARLTTAIRLRASATASGTASARLTTGQATLRASASASGVASARLTTAISLRASATATGTARAVLSAGDIVIEVPPQRRLIAIPGGSTAFFVPSTSTDFSALDF